MGFIPRAREHGLWSLACVGLSPGSSVHTLKCYTRDSSQCVTFLICKVGLVELLQQLHEFLKGWNCTSGI